MTDKLKKQIMAETKQKLEIAVSQAASVAQTYNCLLTRLDFQQEDGLMSSLPLGLNRIKIERSLTTSALAVFVPFVTQELFMGGDAMYYGLNALSILFHVSYCRARHPVLCCRSGAACPADLVCMDTETVRFRRRRNDGAGPSGRPLPSGF